MSSHDFDSDVQETVESDTLEEEDIDEPSMYKVLLHNDDYTPMDFVVEILMFVFNKTVEEATEIMLSVHRKGMGVCGLYTWEVAETKVETVTSLAGENGYPLKCSVEEDK
ncbi:MAG: ATP-dependent Clp protease adapter ClpS [Desulfococcaceae bacterium]